MTHPTTIEKAAKIIEEFEGLETESYLNPVGIPTICTGLTEYENGDPVRMGDICNANICQAYTKEQIIKNILPSVTKIPGWDNFGADRQSALISFAWNMGQNFFEEPDFIDLQEVLKEGSVHPEAYEHVSCILNLYNKSNGVELPGLTKRREIESDIWKRESVGPLVFTASQETYLKKAPLNNLYLSDTGKRFMEEEEEIWVSKVEDVRENNHCWVTLIGSGERWMIDRCHWREKTANNFTTRKADIVDWNIMADRVGRFITVGEVLQYDPRRAPARGSIEEGRLIRLCEQFDKIREAWGDPIGVLGAYRPEEEEKGNYHHKGMALDIYPVKEDFCLTVFGEWLGSRWTGGMHINYEKNYIHIDIRNNGSFYLRN